MASYLDEIPKFREYVSQLPVEAMVKAGLYKQQKYEENVTKIQDQMEKIAGLDVYRDVDKKYLQSQLDELGGRLRTFAAGDFSNFQLANSVSGMTKQIAKDPTVQNAVSSTARIREEQALIKEAIKKGKSSEANIWDFNDKLGKYANSTDLNESFTGRYTPYTDVKKKAMDAIKALHPDLQKYDIPYEVVNGKVNTRKIADAMQRYKIEGVTEEQIQAAISATMTPDDINQLSIDGRYQFRGVGSDQLVSIARQNYQSNKEEAISSLKLLQEKKGITTDPTKLDRINSQIEYYESLLGKDGKPGKLDDQLSTEIKSATEDPDGVKASIYKNGFIKEFANAFSWKNEDMEYVKNPMRDQLNWIAEMKLKQETENRQRYEFSVTSAQKERDLELTAQQIALKNAEIYGVDSPWVTMGNETDMVLNADKMYTDHSESVASQINSGRATLKSAGYSDAQINMMLNKKMDVPAKAMGVVEEILRQQNYLKSLEKKQKKLKAEAREEVVKDPAALASMNKADAFAKTINGGKPITLAPGVTISAKEMGDKLLNGEALIQDIGFGNLAYTDKNTGLVVKIPSTENGVNVASKPGSLFNNVQQVLKYKNEKQVVYKKEDEIYRNKLAPLVSKFVPQWKALGSDKDGAPTAVTLGKVSNLISATIARGIKADDVYDSATSSDMLKSENKKDTRIFIQQEGDNYQIILKSEADPSKVQRIKVSKADVMANFGDKYVNENTQESIRLDLGNGNTNLTGDPNESFMQKAFGNFPGVKRMNVTADLDQDLSNPDLYVPTINIMKKDGRWQSFPLSGQDKLSRVGFNQGKRNLNALTDDVLLKYLKLEYPNFDYSQLDIK